MYNCSNFRMYAKVLLFLMLWSLEVLALSYYTPAFNGNCCKKTGEKLVQGMAHFYCQKIMFLTAPIASLKVPFPSFEY